MRRIARFPLAAAPTRVARITNVPVPLSVPPNTGASNTFSTGRLSPVSIDSSTVERPSTTAPSTGTRSPGRMRIRSPTTTSWVGTSISAPSAERDVVAFYPYSAGNGTYGALFQLDDHGRIALDALSIERRGSLLFALINGRPITELEIDKRVADGKIYIASGLTAADVDSMKKDWRLIGQRKR